MTTSHLQPQRPEDSATETVHVVLPNDSNPLGFMLGGSVMHLIDLAGAIASHRHTRSRVVTAAVDSVEFLHPVKVGDLLILRSRVTCAFHTSLEVEVEVVSEESLTGTRRLTSRAFLTFVGVDEKGCPTKIPPLLVESVDDTHRAEAARARRAQRLEARGRLASDNFSL